VALFELLEGLLDLGAVVLREDFVNVGLEGEVLAAELTDIRILNLNFLDERKAILHFETI